MYFLEQLQKAYCEAEFSKSDEPEWLVFSKTYSFDDSDGQRKDVSIDVRFLKSYPLLPPLLLDRHNVLSSMHSLNGFQCWTRYADIFQQAGLGLIAPSVVENQIRKLIEAHISLEYATVNESPEFAANFEKRGAIDHSKFYVDCEVLNDVVKAGKGKIISSVSDSLNANTYGVNQLPLAADASSRIIPITKHGGSKRCVFFLNVDAILHYDCLNDDIAFLYWLEQASGIGTDYMFLHNIKDEVFIVVVFFNKGLNHHDVVVFRKTENKLALLRHARVSSRPVLFNRHANEFEQLVEKKVALIGIGAIGSMLGMTMLQSGIDSLYIADIDYVDLENTTRSIYCEGDVGNKKTDAFKYRAQQKDADFDQRVLVCDSYKDMVGYNPDILIVSIGDLYQEYIISRDIRKLGFEKAVFVFGHNDCTWGGVYFQDDLHLGCQHCLFLHQKENETLRVPYIRYSSEAVGCGSPSYISTPSDIGLIANLASKLIIERLVGRQKTGPNFYIWQSNPEPAAWRDSHPDRYSLKKYRIAKHADCPC
jgi:hypothetical protein